MFLVIISTCFLLLSRESTAGNNNGSGNEGSENGNGNGVGNTGGSFAGNENGE